jgi:Protein of unknown function (DUF3987)
MTDDKKPDDKKPLFTVYEFTPETPEEKAARLKKEAEEAWPEMDPAAWHGLAGEIVSIMAPETEADPVALLLQILTYFGNATGRGPYYLVNRDRHYANLYLLIAGKSSKSRKGLSAGLVRALMALVDPEWARECISGGLSSGEGVLHAIRDPLHGMKGGEMTLLDPGIPDKRLLLDEREFHSALTVMRREGNIVSRILRDGWDCLPVLKTMTKTSPSRVTGAFISVVGHITITELGMTLDRTSMANGYANRFLYACVRRTHLLPFGGDVVELEELAARMRTKLNAARAVQRVTMTKAARDLWLASYPELAAEKEGLLAEITARAEGQTARLAMIYALIDGEDRIDRVHLEAALAVWTFCRTSARRIFGDVTGDGTADAILKSLRMAGAHGKTRNEIVDLFNRNKRSGEIAQALELLLAGGKARFARTAPARGRPIETWFAI